MRSMIEDRVFVFRASHPDHIRLDEAPKHYLSATCEDIVDTWDRVISLQRLMHLSVKDFTAFGLEEGS
jgi:hypothetical protein